MVKEKEHYAIRSFIDLTRVLVPNAPVALTINGKGVLYKKIPRELSSGNIFEDLLPNANPAEFYVLLSQYENFVAA